MSSHLNKGSTSFIYEKDKLSLFLRVNFMNKLILSTVSLNLNTGSGLIASIETLI